MQNKVVVDTSFVSALLNISDSNHMKSIEVMKSLRKGSLFVIPQTVYLELLCIDCTRLKITRKEIKSFLNKMIDTYVDIDKKFIKGMEKFLTKNNPRVKAMDASILYTAIELEAKLLTFDKKLEKIYFGLIE